MFIYWFISLSLHVYLSVFIIVLIWSHLLYMYLIESSLSFDHIGSYITSILIVYISLTMFACICRLIYIYLSWSDIPILTKKNPLNASFHFQFFDSSYFFFLYWKKKCQQICKKNVLLNSKNKKMYLNAYSVFFNQFFAVVLKTEVKEKVIDVVYH